MSNAKKLLEVPRKMFVVDLNRPLRRIEMLDGILSVTEKSILFRPLSGKIKCCYVGSSAFHSREAANDKKFAVLSNKPVDIEKARNFKKQLDNFTLRKDFFETSDCAELYSGGKRNL